MPVKQEVDVVIVGGGFAGLAAADALRIHAKGATYVVLEGSGRLGGRTLTDEKNGYLDLGGEYIAPSQKYTKRLIERFNLPTFNTWLPDDKPSIYQDSSGQSTFFFGGNYPLTSDVMQGIEILAALVLAAQDHLADPWNMANARFWDAMSVEQWLETYLQTPYARELMTIAIRSAFSVEPREMSFLYLLQYAATCGSFEDFENVRGGGDAIRFTYGTKSLVDRLARAIGQKNIVSDCKVTKIHDDGVAKVTVTAEVGTGKPVVKEWVAKQVIVAMSPVATTSIDYEPPLSSDRKRLCKGAPMARTIKGFLLFKTPWWRSQFTGYVLSDRGPADWMMDNTWQNPADLSLQFPSLMTFIVADNAKKWQKKSKDDRAKALLQQVVDLFDSPTGERAQSEFLGLKDGYQEKVWADDAWARGCPAGCFKPGILTAYGESLRKPHTPRIRWAGSETATQWMGGYMNGAIQSGVRAAGEAVNALVIAGRTGNSFDPTAWFVDADAAAAARPAAPKPRAAEAPAARGRAKLRLVASRKR